ncbi:thymidylate synthase [bacterium]|nr:thymidylate synthase [bacterium]
MQQYLDLIRDVLENGAPSDGGFRSDRTGVGTYSVFGRQLRFDLTEGFPLVTTKKLHLKSIIYELLWFLQGNTNTKWLNDRKVRIWDEWADEDGELGPIYGKLWRRWEGPDGEVDQIQNLITRLREEPYSRRHLVVAYNPADQPKVSPQGCHSLMQFYVTGDRISLQLYQRSADLMLGVPFNIASYALLLQMVAQVVGLTPHEFIHTFGDVHIYANHVEGAKEQLQRTPYPLPTMKLNPEVTDIFAFTFEDFTLENYEAHPHIKFEIAV